MSGAGAWEALLDRSIRAFYEGKLGEGRLACDRLLCLPDLPAHVREVSRTNQVHYARPIADLVPSYREAAINLPMGTGAALRQAIIAGDGDAWLVLFQATMPVITPWDGGGSDGAAGQQAFHVVARVNRELRPVGDAARVANQTVAPGSRGGAARLADCHLARQGQGWVALARVAGEGAGGGELALLDFDPGAPAFRNPRVLMQDAGSEAGTDWMPAVRDDALHLVHLSGATAAVRRDEETGALALAAFNDAPFVAQELHGVSPLVEIGDGLLGLVHDSVTWESGEVSHLYRFARLDRSFQMTDLSHPFLVQGTSGESAGGLAIADGTLALAHVVDGRALHVVALDLAEALALLQPIESLAPGGPHAFPMPGGLLAALQQWAPPSVPDAEAVDLDQIPVLRPETVIAAMLSGADQVTIERAIDASNTVALTETAALDTAVPYRGPLLRTVLYDGRSPYLDFSLADHPADPQGWGRSDAMFEQAIARTRPRRIIEVGTWKGASAIAMALMCQRQNVGCEEIVCIDTWLGAPEHVIGVDPNGRPAKSPWSDDLRPRHGYPQLYFTFLRNVIDAGLEEIITPLPLSSDAAATVLERLGYNAELVYVDASHEYESVYADLRRYWTFVTPGGILLGDDYRNPEHPGVQRAVDEFAAEIGAAIVTDGFTFSLVKPTNAASAVPSAGTLTKLVV